MAADIKTLNLTLALPMRTIGKSRKKINERLKDLASQYIPEADGILLKHTDLTVLNKNGIILDDQPFVFWKVSFTAHVFKPIEGKIVQGKVNKLQKHYIIAKAMDSFSVTVTIPEHLAQNKFVQKIMLEQDIYFKIKSCSGGVYRGELDDECLGLTKKVKVNHEVYDYAKEFEY